MQALRNGVMARVLVDAGFEQRAMLRKTLAAHKELLEACSASSSPS